MRFIILLFLVAFSFSASLAQESGNPFQEGIVAYQKGEYEAAKELFSSLYQEHPANPELMFNLGLSHYHLGQKGLALGLWRKARFLSSKKDPIDQAILFVEQELALNSRDDNIFVTMASWLKRVPTTLWLVFSLLLTLIAGWKIITLFAKRKTPLSDWPLSVFSLIPLWVFCFSVSIWLIIAEMEPTATVVEANVSTRTGPNENSPTLSSLNEGILVKILKIHNEWVQIQPPTGAPGWVLKSQIIAIKTATDLAKTVN